VARDLHFRRADEPDPAEQPELLPVS
jgi:hypothetical protein